MSEWQPIETAPKDRTEVIIFGLWAGEITGRERTPGIFLASYCGPGGDFDGYDWSVSGGDAYASWAKPTHWMPLPEPPKAA